MSWLKWLTRGAESKAAEPAAAAEDVGTQSPVNLKVLYESLELGEARRTRPYVDTVGKLTIGVGRNLTDKGLRQSEIDILLENDVKDAIYDLDRFLPWWRSLDEPRRRVMVEMVFNMGIGDGTRGLLSFRNTLESIRTGRYADAADGMKNSKWATQVGDRAERLARVMRNGGEA